MSYLATAIYKIYKSILGRVWRIGGIVLDNSDLLILNGEGD